MKKLSALIAASAFAVQAAPCLAWQTIGTEMPNPLRSFQENSPSYNPDFYDRTFDVDRSVSGYGRRDYNDAPHGHDIRDYNPYYDRYGNLKPFGDR